MLLLLLADGALAVDSDVDGAAVEDGLEDIPAYCPAPSMPALCSAAILAAKLPDILPGILPLVDAAADGEVGV